MKPAPEGSLIIFAGPADVDERNMTRQLNNWLPQELRIDPPVIQDGIPDDHEGLQKVRQWLEQEFPGEGAVDYIDDLGQFISELSDVKDVFLVVLGRQGKPLDDEPTEKLVDLAMRKGITVLDLNDGLDTLALGEREQPKESRPARRTRRTRGHLPDGSEEQEPAGARVTRAAAQDTAEPAPWEPDSQAPASELRLFAGTCAAGLLAFAGVLRAWAEDPGEAASQEEPAAREETRPAARSRTADKPPPGTTAYYQNPQDKAEYRKRGRGQPRNEVRNWNLVYLTPQQEKERGLT